MCRRALLVACVAAAAARKPEAEPSGAERMAVEIDEAGEQSASMPTDRSAEERAAKAGLAKQYSDALVDIMAVLVHGSEASKESAIERLIELAMDSAHGSDQARMFRSAVVAGGALPVLIEEVQAKEDPHRPYLAATALHALAIDDPTTDLDNFHSVEICQHGAVPPLVALLGSEHEQLQSAATGALSQLAENPVCQQMIAAAGALEPLAKMAPAASRQGLLASPRTRPVRPPGGTQGPGRSLPPWSAASAARTRAIASAARLRPPPRWRPPRPSFSGAIRLGLP